MSLQDITKVSIAFKKLVGRDYSTVAKTWYEETPGGGFMVHAADVWAEDIPGTPPGSSTSVVKVYSDGADGAIKLTEDISVSGDRGWYAEDPPGTRLRRFIPPIFGQAYTVKLYRDNGSGTAKGAQVFTTDDMDWFFDYETGYLAIQDSHGYPTPFWIEVYHYIGSSVQDELGGGTPVPTTGTFDCDASLAVGEAVQMDSTNNKAVLASASGANLGPTMGFVVSKTSSTVCEVAFTGSECDLFSGLVAGDYQYLGVDGAITTTPPTAGGSINQFVGRAKNATTLVFERGEPVFN